MKDADKILDAIKKDWELIPSASKALAIFSALSVWFIASSDYSKSSKNIAIIIILFTNLFFLVGIVFLKPYFLRKKYPLSGFISGEFELVSDGGIWFLVDHKRRKIRWIANMATVVELGFRHPALKEKPGHQTLFEFLNLQQAHAYRASRFILSLGRRGRGIREE